MGIPCRYRVSYDGKSSCLWTTVDRVMGVFDYYDNESDIDLGNGVLYFSRKDWNSLVLKCEGRDDVRKCVEVLGLGLDSDSFLSRVNSDFYD